MKKTKCAWKRIVAGIMLVTMVFTGIPFTQKLTVEAVEGEGTYVPPMEADTVLYEENFDTGYSEVDYSEWLANKIFGEGNYLLGKNGVNSELSIIDGKLRIKGGTALRSQFMVASDNLIAQNGVIIECEYTMNSGSGDYFAFGSKTLSASAADSNDLWISGVWSTGYRTCFRGPSNNNSWTAPGLANTSNATYYAADVTYNLKVEVLPSEGMKLSIKQPIDSDYTLLHHLTQQKIESYTNVSFSTFNDGNIRMIVGSGCDVTIDHLKVYSNGQKIVENNFAEYPEYEEWLAQQIFGERNYMLGAEDAPATLSLENGALTISGGAGDSAKTAQFLLVDNDSIDERGVIIECDYILNVGAGYFAFASRKLETSSFIDSNHIWISGIWSDGYRAGLRGSAYNYNWKGHTPKGTDYNAVGQLYNLKLVVTPDEGIQLYAKTSVMDAYGEPIAKISLDDMKNYPEYNFQEFFDKNVRLLVSKGSSVTLDNIKISKATAEEVIFEDDFSDYISATEHSENLAKEIFGEGNYLLGKDGNDAKLSIVDGGLRIQGGTALRSQFMLASDDAIEEKGAIIECNYTINSGSADYFAFGSKPIATAADSNSLWISGVWSNGYRTAFRGTETGNTWVKPGEAVTNNASYYAAGVTFNLKIEVSPEFGIKLSVKKTTDADYTLLQHLTLEEMAAYPDAKFADFRDGNVRMIVGSGCDVTVDNLKVSIPEDNTVETPLPTGVYFENDFSAATYAQTGNAGLARAVFGADNYLLGKNGNNAKLSIVDGALRIKGGTALRSQYIVATNDDIAQYGTVVECDYTINSGSADYFAFGSKPISASAADSNSLWISGIWSNGYRTAFRGTETGNTWVKPGEAVTNNSSYYAAGVTFNLKIEVTPEIGMKLSVKQATDTEYTLLQHLTLEEMAAYPDAQFADFRDGNVRLIVGSGCDVTIDNLKVSAPFGVTPSSSNGTTLATLEEISFFDNDFNSYKSYAETIAEQMVGVDNYIIGEGKTVAGDATIAVEDGALHIVGDDNTTSKSRTQLMIANDDRIAERGVIVECDYIMNGGENAFNFCSKSLAISDTEQNGNWIAGIWTTGHRASLRSKAAGYTGWIRAYTDDSTYSTIGSKFNLRLEVTPQGYIKLYAKADGTEEYALLARIQKHQIPEAINYRDCLDNYVRLIVQCKADVTIDNLVVKLAPVAHDANYDEQVTIQDIVRMKKAIADDTAYIDGDMVDVNCDSNFDANDILALREYLTKDVAEFTGGTYVDTYACGGASKQDYYTDVDSTQIDSYVEILRDNGYAKQQDNSIGNNRYVTLTGDKGLVHLTYLDYNKSLAVIKDAVNETANKDAVTKYTNVADTSLAVMSLNYDGEGRDDSETNANGESFVVTLRDGRYVIVDGGYGCDAFALYNYLKDNNKRTDGIKIAAWFLSHPHDDHYGALVEFANTYHSMVSVEHVVAADGASSMYESGYNNWFTNTLPTYVNKFNAKLVRPHAGQILKFSDTEFKMLYTGENYLNNDDGELLTSENNASLVFQMVVDEKKVLFTNDSEKQVSELLVSMYGTNLKSDIMQVNHHARSGAIKELIESVAPTYSLWPTNQTTYELRTKSDAYSLIYGDQGVADLQSHTGMQYLLTLMGDNNANCFVADGDVEIIQLNNMTIKSYTPVFTTETVE